MKKRILVIILAATLTLSLFSGCGASGNVAKYEASYDMASGAAAPQAAPAVANNAMPQTEESRSGAMVSGGAGAATQPESDKIIYSAYAEVESLDFDATVEAVNGLIDRYGGFLESSSVTGRDYYSSAYGDTSYRSASFSIRIPREHYADVYGSLESLGNVPYKTSSAENITSQYVDVESRLASYRTQEDRLLELLERAESVEDMITIESRLADIRYQIESLTTTLRGWDSLVNYSSVTLNIREVAEVTKSVTVPRSYWDEVGEALLGSLNSMGRFFKNLFKYLISAMPVILILGFVAVVILLILRARRKKRAAMGHLNQVGRKTPDEPDGK